MERQLKPGDLLYFLLKAPIRKIAGFGHFVSYENMRPVPRGTVSV